eukprot:650717_1
MQSIHCEKIGYPTTISGTVARYTEIRPKLIYRYLNTFPTWVIYTSDKVYSAFVSATNDTGEFVIEAIALLLADNVQYFGPMWFAVKGGMIVLIKYNLRQFCQHLYQVLAVYLEPMK